MFEKFPSINQFREVKRNVEFDTRFRGLDDKGEPTFDTEVPLPTIRFIGTVKLHGTNAAINYTDGVSFQSRENIITPEKDNAGFAQWGSQLPQEFHDTVRMLYGRNTVVFGEWCGGNIQKGVAISGLPKMFVVFAIKHISQNESVEQWMPIEILAFMGLSKLNDYGIWISSQFKTYEVSIDFNNPEAALEAVNNLTLQVEKECPVGKYFGRSGVGEGIVWVPVYPALKLSRLVFKTKGSEHSKVKEKKLAAVNPEKVESVTRFVEKHVNEERLEQAYAWLVQMGHPQNEKSTGHFIKWVLSDIYKEEKDELEYSGLTEKDVNAIASDKARKWFFQKFNK